MRENYPRRTNLPPPEQQQKLPPGKTRRAERYYQDKIKRDRKDLEFETEYDDWSTDTEE